jgi:hypothetical protein
MERRINYDRATRDFACYVDDILIGFAANYHEAELLCDRYIFDTLAAAEPVPSDNDEHRQDRWLDLFNQIDAMPEPQHSEMVRFTLYTINRIIAERPATALAA